MSSRSARLLRASLATLVALLPLAPGFVSAASPSSSAQAAQSAESAESAEAAEAAESAQAADLKRLAAAAAGHPDDPDLSWALARSLAEQGELASAVEQLRGHLGRWPERPPEGWLALARWEYELGHDAKALQAAGHALALDPASGSAHLYAGLASKRSRDFEAARRHFEMAAQLEPELAAEAGLLAGLSQLELGDEEAARRALGELVASHPSSDAANAARLVLHGSTAARAPFASLEAYTGFQYDSNVTLESGVDFPGASSDQDDLQFVWGSALTLRPVRGERLGVEVGVRYDEAAHVDLSEYDTRRFLGVVGGRYRISRNVALRLDASAGYTTLDRDPYLLEATLRPSLLLVLGRRTGMLRAHAFGTRLDYDEEPVFSSLERDGWSYGGGLEHLVPMPLREGAWTSWAAGYRRRDTAADRDLLGFDGAYDHHAWSASFRAHVPLVWAVAADLRAGFDGEDYDNENLIDGLTDGGVGRPDPRRRRDGVWGVGAMLTRPLGRFSELELAWGYTDRSSNVDLYAYDRHVVGFTVRVFTP